MSPTIKKVAKRILGMGIPNWKWLRLLYRMLYDGYWLAYVGCQFIWKLFWVEPCMRGKSEKVGARLRIEQLPYISGKGHIEIGDDVYISGKINVAFCDHLKMDARLRVGSHTFIGHGSSFVIAKEVTIGDHCLIAAGVSFFDNDGHPLDAALRHDNQPITPKDVAGIIVGNDVWIGVGSTILKGVHIGNRAIVGARSVVTKDVPPDTIIAGNPARILRVCSDSATQQASER
jgi:acetyltransferase-like isoleucine patch superfamily enzyme